MKRFLSAFCTLIAFLSFMNPIHCFAVHYDSHQIWFSFSNAPKETAYIDILAKIEKNNEVYTDFNVVPKRLIDFNRKEYVPLSIGKESEIASYQNDGYVSLSIHSILITDLILLSECENRESYSLEYDGYLTTTCSAETLYDTFNDLKLAYVGENGEILQITNPLRIEHTLGSPLSQTAKPYSFIAEGEIASYREPSVSVLNSFLFFAPFLLIILFPIIIVILFVWIPHQKRKRDKQALNNQNDF